MTQWILMAACSLLAPALKAQQHFLNLGEIAPCNYTGKPNIRMETNTVTVLLPSETPVYSHICGKVVSVFKVSNQLNVIIKTSDNLYVSFGNLKQLYLVKGDEIQMQSPIGLPLPGPEPGTWIFDLSYDTREGSLSCQKAIEMIRRTQANTVVMQAATK